MPQHRTLRRLPLLRVAVGLLGMLALAVVVGFLGRIALQHATQSHPVLDRFDVSASLSSTDNSLFAGRFIEHTAHMQVSSGALVRSRVAEAPAAAVSGSPFEPQHPDTPLEAPETGEGSIEAGDDLSDFDDFAYHLRVVFDGTAQLNREVERGVSLGGRAVSRLEDNRNDKPPRG